MNGRTLLRNATLTAGRIVLSALVMLFLYRYLLDRLGADMLGIWALVMATTTAGSVAGMGMNGTLVKFVADSHARGDRDRSVALLHTAVLAAGTLLSAAASLLLVFGPLLLSTVLPLSLVAHGTAVFPVAVAVFWLTSIAGLYQSYCEGLQRYDLTNLVLLAGAVLYAILCTLLVPLRGLPGVAFAALGQALALLLGFLLACKMASNRIPLLPTRWRHPVFKELLPYGARLQLMTVSSMLVDPVTKYCVGLFGGIAPAAYYDLAARLIGVIRQFLVSINTTLLPAISILHGSDPARLESAHRRDFSVILLLSATLLLGPGALAGFIAVAWLGTPVPEFVLALVLLSIGWFVNAISSPSYLFFLGRGELGWPLTSHLVIGLLNPILAVVLGGVGGYWGVVTGFMVALISGSVVTMAAYERARGRKATGLLDRTTLMPVCASALSFLICHGAFLLGKNALSHAALLTLGLGLLVSMVFFTLRLQPGRFELRRAAVGLADMILPPGRRAG